MSALHRHTFALAIAVAFTGGCDETEQASDYYLGPIEAGVLPDAAVVDSPAAPPIGKLSQEPCSGPVLQGKDEGGLVRSIAAMQARMVLASSSAVESWQLGAQGCPETRNAAFGTDGRVTMGALSAALLPPSRVLVATGDTTVVLDSDGQVAGTCLDQGAPLKARWVASEANGTAVASVVRSPVGVISTDLGTGACTAQLATLSPESFALLALVPAKAGGFFAAEQDVAFAPIALSRYDETGKRLSTVSRQQDEPGALCSAAGMVQTDQGIVVVDSACKRAVLYDTDTLQPLADAVFDDVPRAVAWTGEGSTVLVAVTRSVAGGAEASFIKLQLL